MTHWITEHVAISGAAITPANWRELLENTGIGAVVNLRAEHQDVFTSPLPIAYLWLPVEDYDDPTPEQLMIGAQFIDAEVRAEHRVFIHCKMGIGRAPTMAAAYLVWTGLSTEEAVQRVEGLSPQPNGPAVSRIALRHFETKMKQQQAV